MPDVYRGNKHNIDNINDVDYFDKFGELKSFQSNEIVDETGMLTLSGKCPYT